MKMEKIMLQCGKGIGGKGEGRALVSKRPFSFFSDVDPETGVVASKLTLPELYGMSVAGKVLVFPTGKGGTFSTWELVELKVREVAPSAMINARCHPVFAYGAAIAEIPYVELRENDSIESIETGDYVVVEADKGVVTITKRD